MECDFCMEVSCFVLCRGVNQLCILDLRASREAQRGWVARGLFLLLGWNCGEL